MAIVNPLNPPRIHVLAGVNGAGKSSVGGAAIRHFGADFYNPDEAARRLRDAQPGLTQEQANSAAWQHGRRLLEAAITQRLDFAFETTLGANTLTRLLAQAAGSGFAVQVWYAGLASPELHLQRVRSRVLRGGHDIAEVDIRRRWDRSRLNLIHLLPQLAALRVYDNSLEADPASGVAPQPQLVLHQVGGRIVGPADLSATPEWAKPIVAAAIKTASARSAAAS